MHELLGGSDLTHGMPCKMKLFLFSYFVILIIILWKMGLQDPDPSPSLWTGIYGNIQA